MSIPVSIAVAIDRVMGVMSSVAQGTDEEHQDTRRDLEQYYDLPLEKAFPEPPVPENVYLSASKTSRQITAEEFRFDSAHEPLCEAYQRRHAREYPLNLQVCGRIFRHLDERPRPMALYIHGWMEPGPAVEERVLFPRFLKDLDIDVAHIHLPFHGKRRPPHTPFHGMHFWTSDLVRSFEAMRQSVSDVRQLVRYLKQRFGRPVGLVGVSLGGVVTMAAACADAGIDFAIPIISHLSMADIVTRAPILAKMNGDLEKWGVTREELERIEKRLGLNRFPPLVPKERQLWIAARHDLYVHADAVEKQWENWGRPPIRWYEGSHLSIVFEIPQILAWCGEFLEGTGLLPRHGMERKKKK
ncbi:MAG: alpha/beta fold hydrolase [Bdellovibrionota bacterium]